jgi:integrase
MAKAQKTRYPGIYKTPYGSYETSYRDPSRRQRTKSFKRLQEALDFQTETKRALRRGDFVDPTASQAPFGEWAEKYLAQKLNIGRRTRDKYRESLDNHLLPEFARMPLGSITSDHVQEWVVQLSRTEHLPGKTYAAVTIRGHYALFAAIMKKAAGRGLIAKSPCVEIDLPEVVHVERRYLAEDDVATLIGVMPRRYKSLVAVGAYLGLRWQELAGLRRGSVNMRPGKIPSLRVTSVIERSNDRYEVKEYGKSAAAHRTLKMPNWVAEGLCQHLRGFLHDEWVFPSPDGSFLRYENFRTRVWKPSTEAAGIAPLNFHELRHTAAAFMIAEGANALQVKRRMGHEDIRTTFHIYGHLFDDDEDALVKRLDRRARSAAQRRDLRTVRVGVVQAFEQRR